MDTNKLKDIQKRIKELKPAENLDTKPTTEVSPFTIAIDLVSGTMVGVVCGLLTDKFFNSKPFFLIIFTIIGILAGFNIIRQRLNNKK
ncbi:MAG: AtpZ/AtpI family protein [Rickettsia endosymbiont of Argas persicus]